MRRRSFFTFYLAALLLMPAIAGAQAIPRLAAIYPAGARAGATLEVALQGGGLAGAAELFVSGTGVRAQLRPSSGKGSPADRKIFEARCSGCHELRGPAQISRTAEQWEATLERMIRQQGAPIEGEDRAAILRYLQAEARAAAGLTAQLVIDAAAAPGRREIRVKAADGVSTAFPFEIGSLPEILETEPNDSLNQATQVTLPAVLNGRIDSRDSDSFKFRAEEGHRFTFNCLAWRMNPAQQESFFPMLQLTDAEGRELVRSSDGHGLDPFIDWTCPRTGDYLLSIRDLLYRGSPASVYRLTCGELPYDVVAFPPGAQKGATPVVTLYSAGQQVATQRLHIDPSWPPGSRRVKLSGREVDFRVGEDPDLTDADTLAPQSAPFPSGINGRFLQPGETDTYEFDIGEPQKGAWEVRVITQSIGSRATPRITWFDFNNRPAGSTAAAPDADAVLDINLPRPGKYRLQVSDERRSAGPAAIYRIEIARARPVVEATVAPDIPSVAPGGSVLLLVNIVRSAGMDGPLGIQAVDLPPGVASSSMLLVPPARQGYIVLTAAADAKPGAHSRARVLVRGTAAGQPLEFEASPREIYRIQNQPGYHPRSDLMVSIAGSSPYRVRIEGGGKTLSASGSLALKLILERGDSKGDVAFAVVGLPPGVQAPRTLIFRGTQTEQTLTLTGSRSGVFTPPPSAAPVEGFYLTVTNGREGESQLLSARPVLIPLEIEAPKAR